MSRVIQLEHFFYSFGVESFLSAAAMAKCLISIYVETSFVFWHLYFLLGLVSLYLDIFSPLLLIFVIFFHDRL